MVPGKYNFWMETYNFWLLGTLNFWLIVPQKYWYVVKCVWIALKSVSIFLHLTKVWLIFWFVWSIGTFDMWLIFHVHFWYLIHFAWQVSIHMILAFKLLNLDDFFLGTIIFYWFFIFNLHISNFSCVPGHPESLVPDVWALWISDSWCLGVLHFFLNLHSNRKFLSYFNWVLY